MVDGTAAAAADDDDDVVVVVVVVVMVMVMMMMMMTTTMMMTIMMVMVNGELIWYSKLKTEWYSRRRCSGLFFCIRVHLSITRTIRPLLFCCGELMAYLPIFYGVTIVTGATIHMIA